MKYYISDIFFFVFFKKEVPIFYSLSYYRQQTYKINQNNL